MGVPRAAHPDPRERPRDFEHRPTLLKGTGNLGIWPRVLSSLQFPWMALEDHLPGMWGSLAEGPPFSDPSLQSAQGHLRPGSCSEADVGGGYLRTQGQGQTQSDLTSGLEQETEARHN